MAEESKLQDMIRTSLESIRTMVDANTVVGNPIETPSGTTIIPISKVSVGYASGGLDYDGKVQNPKKNFAGGGGTGLSVQPICFIAVHAEGSVELLPLSTEGKSDAVDKIAGLIEKTPDIFARIKRVFGGKHRDKKQEESAEEDVKQVSEEAAKAVEKVTEQAVHTVENAAEKAADAIIENTSEAPRENE